MTVVKPGDKVARIRAQMLHILYEIGREDHQFRLRYNGQYLRDAFYLEDYNLESNSVVHMVPLSDKKDDVRLYEPRREKNGLRGFLPGPTQTGLCSYRRWLEF